MPEGSASGRFADVRRFASVGSTNRLLAEMAAGGAPDGVVVVADHQTAGRGRLGRRWEARPGTSLLVSVLLRPAPAGARATVAMALAAAAACGQVCRVRPGLKWPNDLVAGGAKLGGVLGESAAGAAVVGLGLNTGWGPHQPPPPGISLDRLAGAPVDRDALLDALLAHLEPMLAEGPDRLRDLHLEASETVGRRVAVRLADRTVQGQAVDVTAEGHLVIDTGGHRVEVAAGDVVHLRPD